MMVDSKNHVIDDAKFIRERIKDLLKQRGVSAQQMSLELGYSRNYISQILTVRALPSVTGLLEICRYFEVSPNDFFGEGVEVFAPPPSIKMIEAFNLIRKLDEKNVDVVLNVLGALSNSGGSTVAK